MTFACAINADIHRGFEASEPTAGGSVSQGTRTLEARITHTPTEMAAMGAPGSTSGGSEHRAGADRDGYEDICLQFGVVLGDLLRSQAHWRSDFYDIAAVTASVVPRAVPQQVAASALSNYGTSLSMQRKYEEAHAAFHETVSMYEPIGDPIVPAGRGETSPICCKRKAGMTTRSLSIGRTSSSVRRPHTHIPPPTP
jgi:hypothetical protein